MSNEAPKKIWVIRDRYVVDPEKACERIVPYSRTDLVDELVDALNGAMEAHKELVLRLSLEQDILIGDSRIANAQAALKALEEE